MIMIALLAADVLPSTGFSPNVLPETRLWFWSSNNNMRREPSRLPQACRQAILRGKTLGACAPRMAISQASGFPLPPAHKSFLRMHVTCPCPRVDAGICRAPHIAGSNQIQWPTLDEVTPPVHVKIAASAQSAPDVSSLGSLVPPVGKKTIADYAVQVNDKFRKPLRSGYFPLRVAYGDRIEGADLEGARFALTGDLRIGCPSYMHLLPPVAGESVQRLWITSFGMARAGGVVGLDLTGKLPALRLKTELAWPNAVEHVPEDFLAPLFGEGFNVTASLLIADGFLVPGKTDGGVFLVRNPGSREELSARLTRTDDSRWFYHRAIPFEMQGHKGVLTARALKPLSPFQAARGELLWLEAPNATNPTAPWNVPWREVVLAEGPDVMFEVVDLDRTDDTVEVFAAEFFAQRLTMHSLKWDSSKNQPAVVQREVLDDSLGQAYSVAIGDLEGPNSHLLVTTHEYLPVPTKGGLTLGSSSSWSYMKDSLAPQQAQEVNGGSLFAYRIPTVWRRRSDGYVPSIDTFKAMLPEMFARIDADGSGEISVNELEASLSWLRVQVTPETLRSAFEDADW